MNVYVMDAMWVNKDTDDVAGNAVQLVFSSPPRMIDIANYIRVPSSLDDRMYDTFEEIYGDEYSVYVSDEEGFNEMYFYMIYSPNELIDNDLIEDDELECDVCD